MTDQNKILDPEQLKNQDKLTPEQEEELYRQAVADRETPPNDEVDVPENDVKPEEEKLEEPKKEEEPRKEEQEDGEEKPKKEEKEDGDGPTLKEVLAKPEAERSEQEKAMILEQQESEAQAWADRVSSYAKEFRVTEKEAKEHLEAESEIQKNYGGDISKLARAHRNLRQLQVETSEKLKSAQTELEKPRLPEGAIKVGDKVYASEAEIKPDLVESYRKEFPVMTKEKDDDEVFEMAKRDLILNARRHAEDRSSEVKSSADLKRKTVLEGLTNSDSRIKEAVEVALSKTPDAVLANPKYDGQELVSWAKGLVYDEDIERVRKEAFDEGFAKGKEKARIVTPAAPGGGSSKSRPPKKKPSALESMTTDEKERALSMFDGQPMTDDEKFQAYLDQKNYEQELAKSRAKP